MTTKNEWLNPRETSKRYGFSVSTLAKWRMERRNLKFSKMGKYIRYSTKDIEEFIQSNVQEVA